MPNSPLTLRSSFANKMSHSSDWGVIFRSNDDLSLSRSWAMVWILRSGNLSMWPARSHSFASVRRSCCCQLGLRLSDGILEVEYRLSPARQSEPVEAVAQEEKPSAHRGSSDGEIRGSGNLGKPPPPNLRPRPVELEGSQSKRPAVTGRSVMPSVGENTD